MHFYNSDFWFLKSSLSIGTVCFRVCTFSIKSCSFWCLEPQKMPQDSLFCLSGRKDDDSKAWISTKQNSKLSFWLEISYHEHGLIGHLSVFDFFLSVFEKRPYRLFLIFSKCLSTITSLLSKIFSKFVCSKAKRMRGRLRIDINAI